MSSWQMDHGPRGVVVFSNLLTNEYGGSFGVRHIVVAPTYEAAQDWVDLNVHTGDVWNQTDVSIIVPDQYGWYDLSPLTNQEV